MRAHRGCGFVLVGVVGCGARLAAGQGDGLLPTIPTVEFAAAYDSGPLKDGKVAQHVVTVPGAAWVRVKFGAMGLAGDPAADGSFVRITSTLDGSVQTLTREQVDQWAGTSAYFNGPEVLVELVSRSGAGVDRLVIVGAWAGMGVSPRTVCGLTDDRVESAERANARLLPGGCTAWIFDDLNHSFLAAGHCFPDAGTVIEFNVPRSGADGTLVHPDPRDQYAVEPTSAQLRANGPGDDWSYFGVFPNSQTGLTPYQAQGAEYAIAEAVPAVDGQRVRVTGYGITSPGAPREFNQVQRTHTGDYAAREGDLLYHTADTTAGNSGAPIYLLDTRTVIGIHTHAGCTATDGANRGTAVTLPTLREALAHPRGVCRTGGDALWGDLFVVGDLANNVGAMSAETASFGQMAQGPPGMQGLAYDWNREQLFALAAPARLYTMSPETGVCLPLGDLTGATGTLNALAYDPWNDRLFAMAQASGQLYAIDPASREATAIGAAGGGTVGGMDFDPVRRVLFALDDMATGTRLLRIDPATGARVVVGVLGAGGVADCNGLAYRGRDAMLYTIHAPTGRLLVIDPQTGAARVVGSTGGLFGAGYGLAARVVPPLCARTDYNRDGNSDQSDVADLLQAIASGVWTVDPDLNADGQTDMSDVGDLIAALAAGC